MYAKLTYFLSCIALLASSCSSDNPSEPASDKGVELSFDVSALSRATVTTSFDKFAVFGDIRFQGNTTLNPIVLFNNTDVEYKDGHWTYEGTQYWMPEYEHSFVAISPVSVLQSENNSQYSNSQLSFTYTIPTTEGNLADRNDVTDILAATHRRLYPMKNAIDDNNREAPITLRFNHILSLINFAPALDDNIMNSDEYILISRLELSGFKTKAKFDILPASIQSNSMTDDQMINISVDQETEAKLTIDFPTRIKVKNNREFIYLLGHDDAVIMLPQNFEESSEAQISVYYSVNNDPSVKQIDIPLKKQSWETGKYYTYKFTINSRGAHFQNTIITDWDKLDVGNIDAH